LIKKLCIHKKNSAYLTELEAGFMEGILANYVLSHQVEAGLMTKS